MGCLSYGNNMFSLSYKSIKTTCSTFPSLFMYKLNDWSITVHV